MKKISFYCLMLLLLTFSSVKISHAENFVGGAADNSKYTLLEPLPCVPTAAETCKPGEAITTFTVNQFIEYVFKFSIALAVLLAVIMIIWGGFEYMLSESPFPKLNAKEKFTNAALGLGGALISYLVLQ